MTHKPYRGGLATEIVNEDKALKLVTAEIALRSFLGLPLASPGGILVDGLSVSVTLVDGIHEPVTCRDPRDFETDILVVAYVDPETGSVYLLGWTDPCAFGDDSDPVDHDGDIWYAQAQEQLYRMPRLKAQGEPTIEVLDDLSE